VLDGSVNTWLRRETPKHTQLLTKLREKLEATLENRYDEDGHKTHADVNENGTPSRDWCRAYQRYQNGYVTLLAEQREQLKLQLMARRGGQEPLSDEEYERGMRELAIDALRELSTDDLAKEFLRRGHSLPVGEYVGDDS
jgi:hypothetical protein